MELTINIEDYLKPDDIKAICMEEIRSVIRSRYGRSDDELNRMIVNVGYDFIFKAVSDAIGEDAKKKIENKVKDLIDKDDSTIKYNMWRRKSIYEAYDSPAVKIMNRAIEDSEGLIRRKVMQAIDEYSFSDVKDAICNALDEVIYDKIFGNS